MQGRCVCGGETILPLMEEGGGSSIPESSLPWRLQGVEPATATHGFLFRLGGHRLGQAPELIVLQ